MHLDCQPDRARARDWCPLGATTKLSTGTWVCRMSNVFRPLRFEFRPVCDFSLGSRSDDTKETHRTLSYYKLFLWFSSHSKHGSQVLNQCCGDSFKCHVHPIAQLLTQFAPTDSTIPHPRKRQRYTISWVRLPFHHEARFANFNCHFFSLN